jgi:hypothetical protein
MWLPPLVEQPTSSQGKMERIQDWLSDPRDRHGIGEAYRVVGAQLSQEPEWVAGAELPNPFGSGEVAALAERAPFPLLALLFLGSIVSLWRRRVGTGLVLAGTVTMGLLLGVVSVMRVQGPLLPYLVRWTWVLGLAAALVVLWGVICQFPARWRGPSGWPVLAVAVGLTVVSAINSVSAVRAGPPHASEVAASLTRSVFEALPAGDDPVLLRGTSFRARAYQASLALELERGGVPVRVETRRYGRHRIYNNERVRTVLTVATDDDIDRLLADDAARLVARFGNLSLADRADVKRRIQELESMYESGVVSADEFFQRTQALRRRLGDDIAVFATPDP